MLLLALDALATIELSVKYGTYADLRWLTEVGSFAAMSGLLEPIRYHVRVLLEPILLCMTLV